MQLGVDLGVGCFLAWSTVNDWSDTLAGKMIWRKGVSPLMLECACENARKKSATVEKLDTIPACQRQLYGPMDDNAKHTLTTAPARPNLLTMTLMTAFFASRPACGTSSGGPVEAINAGKEESRSFAAAWPKGRVLAADDHVEHRIQAYRPSSLALRNLRETAQPIS